jgi:hypothetical protein
MFTFSKVDQQTCAHHCIVIEENAMITVGKSSVSCGSGAGVGYGEFEVAPSKGIISR